MRGPAAGEEKVMTAKPVVVGVDGSEESLRAVEWGAREAQRRRAPLHIVSVAAMPPRMRAHHEPTQTVADALQEVSVRALSEATARAGAVAPGLSVDTDLLSGPPATAVTDSGSDAMVLVVGARGMGRFTALLLGSVSRYAATHAACPVIVVREETTAAQGEIAVGIRSPDDADRPLSFAFEEAVLRDAALVAVHSTHWFSAALGRAGDGAGHAHREQVAAEASGILTEAMSGLREKYPAVPVRQDVVHDHPAKALAWYSAHADLVVIGRREASGPGLAVGAVLHGLLSHARGPVAVVPAQA
jgi:nucleotide-binding universal stress UspA family protein